MATANVGGSDVPQQKILSKHTRVRLIRRNGKKVRAHRWIMGQHIGRPLASDEDVHHINHNPLDNRIENLQLMKRVDHVALHKAINIKYEEIRTCVVCGAEFSVPPKHRGRNKCCSAPCARTKSMQTRMANAASGVKPFKTASDETKQNMSQTRTGAIRKPHSEETKQKMREAATKRNAK